MQSPVTKEILQSGIEQHTESDNQQEKSKPKNEPLPQDEHSEIKNDDKLIDIKKHDGIPNETPEELSQAEVEEGQPNDNKEIKDRGSNGTAKAAVTESKDEVAAKQGTELPVETDKNGTEKEQETIDSIKVNNSKIGQFNAVNRDSIFINNLNQIKGVEGGYNLIEEKSLIEFTTILPNKDKRLPDFFTEDLVTISNNLNSERLMLVSCIDHGLAQAAAYALIEKLCIQDESRRLLNFDRIEGDISNLNIYQLLKEGADSDKQKLIVVDARSDKARRFLDSLFSTTDLTSKDIKQSLQSNKLLLICLVDPEETGKRLGDQKREFYFTYWEIPFLRQLLRSYSPNNYIELEIKILEQRDNRRWSKDESVFFKQIMNSIKLNNLIDLIEKGGVTTESVSVTPLFDYDKPVHNLVLYIGTFFSNLSPNDFNKVISVLFGDQTTTITVTTSLKDEDGKLKTIEIQKEKQLIDIWRESSDKILRECHLITSRDSNKAIMFSDTGLIESLKSYLEYEYGLYLHSKFVSIYDIGLLFATSEQIAKSVIRLSVDMVTNYPDSFGKDWLFEVIVKVRQFFKDNSCTFQNVNMFHLLGTSDGIRSKTEAYKRISELIREILEHCEQKYIVKGLIEQLMREGFYDSVLEITKNLRFVPEFDEFYWIKQLIDRGNDDIRSQVYIYIYREVKKMNLQVYQILHVLESWLPAVDQDIQKYSPSNKLVLYLIIEYCLEITSRFDPKNYGKWPSLYPLLTVKNIEAAKKDFELLSRWIFHPGIKYVMEDKVPLGDLNRLLSALVAEWVFILLGQPAQPIKTSQVSDEGDPKSLNQNIDQVQAASYENISADIAFKILLRQIIEKTNTSQQNNKIRQDMLMYWEDMKNFLTDFIEIIGSNNHQLRKELIWKRNHIRNLLRQFRSMQRQFKELYQQ